MLMQSSFSGAYSLTSIAISAVIFAAALYLLSMLSAHASIDHLPVLGEKGQTTFYKTLENAYFNIKNLHRLPFRRHDIVWIPPRFISEVSSLPESKVSVARDSMTRFHGKYTGLGIMDFHFVDVIRIHVTRNLAKYIGAMEIAVAECFDSDSPDWEEVTLHARLLQVVGRLTARMFVPEQLSKNPVWVNLMIDYTMISMQAVEELHGWPIWTHPVVSRCLPKCRQIVDMRAQARDLLRPVLEDRRRLMESDPTDTMPADTLTWTIKEKGPGGWDPDYQARIQILIAVGSIHTTTNALVNTILDIINNPGVADELRTEYTDVLAANDGKMNKIALNNLIKFDSVMRESQRLNPSHAIAIGRVATLDLKLSGGQVVPSGVHFLFSSAAANRDPAYYSDPNQFDPWRFVKLRQAEKDRSNEGKWQFVATSPNSLGFGHGTHACPGRFFASNEMRLILGNLLLRYDFKFPPGKTRPESLYGETTISPNPSTKVLIKARV
ncbi:TBC domain-containing protein C4G8.04 [Fonsecaea nubica]|uniref:TBC domain-containing protein C4G8.04 n=1 Tax=Fonsecaea nubica TaxID=856822 RepID=A0A178CEB8_9EURO|nr:TBC domain-containing protein C4G8.04 [Fonsecaea nubica]OAL27837.1 TBC domain-containing protein C4G8.04 [Fonsecaea nubica]